MIKFITNFLNSILSYFSPYLLSNRCNPEAKKQKVNENKNKNLRKEVCKNGILRDDRTIPAPDDINLTV